MFKLATKAMPEGRIAVVDDEAEFREVLRSYLEREGFQIVELDSGRALVGALPDLKPDLILLDIMMPHMDGYAVLRELARFPYIPVIMLTARKDDEDKVISLEMGADDFLGKPFNPRELIARVKAIFRRKQRLREKPEGSTAPLLFGPLTVDLDGRQVFLDDNPLPLTVTEFSLLQLFASHRGKVFSRDEILDRIWGEEFLAGMRTVDVHVNNLRKKLSPAQDSRQFIQSVRGLGYKFVG